MFLTYSLWLATISLKSLLLVHLLRLRLVTPYSYFFAYLAITWGAAITRWIGYHYWNLSYSWVYWITELLTTLCGFLVVIEIFRHTFKPFPAIRRVVGWFSLLLILTFLSLYVGLTLLGSIRHGWYELFFQLVRWVQFLQAGLLAALIAAAFYYALPLGRNVAGMAMGFGLFASLAVISFVSQALGYVDLAQLSDLYAITSLLALSIWVYALRAYAPNPLAPRRVQLEQDFARLNSAVISALLEIRGSLRKALGV